MFRRIYNIANDLVRAGYVSERDFKFYVLVTRDKLLIFKELEM